MGEKIRGLRESLIGLLLIGSIWGLTEIVVGGAMHKAGIPHKGDILTATGMGLMAISLAGYHRTWMPLPIALIAASMKQLAIPVLGLSFFCKANSCLAMALGGTSLALVASVGRSKLNGGWYWQSAIGALSAFLAGVGFYFIGMRLAPCNYLLSFNRPGGFTAFIGAEAIVWASLTAVTFPVGYLVGNRISSVIYSMRLRRSWLYYATSIAIITSCWIGAAIAIAKGM